MMESNQVTESMACNCDENCGCGGNCTSGCDCKPNCNTPTKEDYKESIKQKFETKLKESTKKAVLEDFVGKPISEEEFDRLAEKQDACYHKVKARYKVWPSAYASGALVQCRKKGAANWGNKSKK